MKGLPKSKPVMRMPNDHSASTLGLLEILTKRHIHERHWMIIKHFASADQHFDFEPVDYIDLNGKIHDTLAITCSGYTYFVIGLLSDEVFAFKKELNETPDKYIFMELWFDEINTGAIRNSYKVN